VQEIIIVNHRRPPRISHLTQPPRQKKDVRRNTENWPLGLEVGEACAKRGRTRRRAGQHMWQSGVVDIAKRGSKEGNEG